MQNVRTNVFTNGKIIVFAHFRLISKIKIV